LLLAIFFTLISVQSSNASFRKFHAFSSLGDGYTGSVCVDGLSVGFLRATYTGTRMVDVFTAPTGTLVVTQVLAMNWITVSNTAPYPTSSPSPFCAPMHFNSPPPDYSSCSGLHYVRFPNEVPAGTQYTIGFYDSGGLIMRTTPHPLDVVSDCSIGRTWIARAGGRPGEAATVFTDSLVFGVAAADPDIPLGTPPDYVSGAGIKSVALELVDPSGRTVYRETDPEAPYCLFGQARDRTCNAWQFADHQNTWPDGAAIVPGHYLVRAAVDAFYSNDETQEWPIEIARRDWPPLPFKITQVATAPALPDTMAVVTETWDTGAQNVLWTLDGGKSWQQLLGLPPGAFGLIRNAAVVRRSNSLQPLRILLAYEDTVYRTGDFGLTWAVSITATRTPLNNDYLCDLHNLQNGTPSQTLYVEETCRLMPPVPRPAESWIGTRFHVSTDAGLSWRTLPGDALRGLVPSPVLPDRLYAGDGMHALNHQSDDGGITWQPRPTLEMMEIAVPDRADADHLYGLKTVAAEGSPPGQQRSSDGGNSWQDWAGNPCFVSRNPHVYADAYPLVATGRYQLWARCETTSAWNHSKWYYSGDGGGTWRLGQAVDADVLVADHAEADGALMANAYGLWRSTRGADWDLITRDFAGPAPTRFYLPYLQR
jgi:hypothetical protein